MHCIKQFILYKTGENVHILKYFLYYAEIAKIQNDSKFSTSRKIKVFLCKSFNDF